MKLVILGGGPAGYAAASAAAHVGGEVTLVEELSLGGNCTMTDAIPSKTLLTSADGMREVARAEETGLDFVQGFPSVNLRRTLARARAVALHQSRGVRERMDGMNVRVLPGRGRVTGPTGCEFADFFSRCGSRVTLVSARDQLLPSDDPDLAEVLEEVFLRRGMDVIENGRASAIDTEDGDSVRLVLEDGRDLTSSHVLLCIGMRPNTLDLGRDEAGVEFGDRGALP